MELETKLTEISGAIQTLSAKATEEIKNLGAQTKETRDLLEKLVSQHKETQAQLDALDEKVQAKALADTAEVPLGEYLKKETDFEKVVRSRGGERTSFVLKGHHAALALGLKTTLTSDNVGSTPRQTTGVLAIERDSGITTEARRVLRVRDLLASRPTQAQVIDFVKVATALSDGAIQSPEGSAKSENTLTFTATSRKVVTVATWLPCSRQLLADWSEAESFIRTGLAYYVRKETEDQILNGNGAGTESISGLITNATAFNTSLLPAAASGWTLIDKVGWAAAQIAIADEVEGSFCLLNPQDLYHLRMTKDTTGQYILGDPWSANPPQMFGMTLVGTTAMSQGTFLVGSGDPAAAEVRSRMEIEIAVGEQHSTYFTSNLVAIRAEERMAVVVKRGASFITGTTTTSPA